MAAQLGLLRQTQALVICPVVYAELLAGPGASVAHIRPFLLSTGITLDEQLALDIWEEAGRSYGDHAARRKASSGGLPRRLLADFVVGAHASLTGAQLVTLDPQHYRLAFPTLSVIVP